MDSLLVSRQSLNHSSNEEKRVLEKSKSLLNWLTQRNFDKIKNEIVQTIKASPSSYIVKSLVCCIFDMAMVDNAYALFSHLCVELIYAIPPFRSAESHADMTTFERLFLSKCRFELENSSPNTNRPPLVYVDESNCWKFFKTVQILAEVFKNKMVTDTTRQSIIQVLMNPIFPPGRNTDAMSLFLSSIGKLAEFQFCDESFKQQLVKISKVTEMESKYNDEVKLRQEAEDSLARKKEELEMFKQLLESYKEEQGKLQLQTQALEQKHQEELQLRKETEYAFAKEWETLEKVKLQLHNLENEHEEMRLKNEELESKYNSESILRKESETLLEKEREELEEMMLVLETCNIEQESLTSQVRTWQEKYNEESNVRKETEDTLSRSKQELVIVKGLLETYNQHADAMKEERDNALKSVQELTMKQSEPRELPSSFYCPITQDVMKEPHFTADGHTYEAEAIKRWLNTHDTSPMSNLKLPHRNLLLNRALKTAIEELRRFSLSSFPFPTLFTGVGPWPPSPESPMAKKSKPPHKFSSSGSQPRPPPRETVRSDSRSSGPKSAEPLSSESRTDPVASAATPPQHSATSQYSTPQISLAADLSASGTGISVILKQLRLLLTLQNNCAQLRRHFWLQLVISQNIHRWENFILAQFHGKAPSPGALHAIANGIWSKRLRDITVSKLSDRSFLIRIPCPVTRQLVLAQGMWHIENQSMFVGKWEPGLTPAIPKLTFAPVWVDFRGVPHQFFSEEALEHVAGLVGDPVRVHPATLNMTNLAVARVLTIIDPSKPLPEFVNVRFQSGEISRIEVSSPWLPPMCDHCRDIGHSIRSCPTAPVTCSTCSSRIHVTEVCPRIKKTRLVEVVTSGASQRQQSKGKEVDRGPPTPAKAKRKKVRQIQFQDTPAIPPSMKGQGQKLPPASLEKGRNQAGTSTNSKKLVHASSSEAEPYSSDSEEPDLAEDPGPSGEDDNPEVDDKFVEVFSRRQLKVRRKKDRNRGSVPIPS
ncbi:hypothetical protein AALP_AA4G004100 [Arabis alpina]|uniref:RING-type E3 ubiquitin transferase n=1 Tax=Arabis alpina TaxID=50452 RepID=A0A087H089_ARAAL|nr:hypothetical protein AALP_AA4G004100 [Arabis alpina]